MSTWVDVCCDTFTAAPAPAGWTDANGQPYTATESCGSYGYILGGYQGGNGLGGPLNTPPSASTYIERTCDLSAYPTHDRLRLTLSFIKIDSWDTTAEYGKVWINGVEVWSQDFFGGPSQECGRPDWANEGSWANEDIGLVNHEQAHTNGNDGSQVVVKVGSTLSHSAQDESFGVRDSCIQVRVPVSEPSPPPSPLPPTLAPPPPSPTASWTSLLIYGP